MGQIVLVDLKGVARLKETRVLLVNVRKPDAGPDGHWSFLGIYSSRKVHGARHIRASS
jgi:hypothetical protein